MLPRHVWLQPAERKPIGPHLDHVPLWPAARTVARPTRSRSEVARRTAGARRRLAGEGAVRPGLADDVSESSMAHCISDGVPRRSLGEALIVGSGFAKSEAMPRDACQFFYFCDGCGAVPRPKASDCCVFCSFGSVPCLPIQAERSGINPTECCNG